MNDSVLGTIKKMLGLEEEYTPFDEELVVLINTILMNMSQFGAVDAGVRIEGADETWDDIVGERTDVEGIKTYIYLKVRSIFDPPASSSVSEALKNAASEIEWRLSIRVDDTGSYV